MKHFGIPVICAGILGMVLLDAHACLSQTPLKKTFGFGFTVIEPTAVTFKIRTARSAALDLSIGKSALGYPSVRMDFLWQFNNVVSTPSFSSYTGIGIAVGFDKKGEYFLFKKHADSSHWFVSKDPVAAGRLVLGIDFIPRYAPIELFAEVNPLIAFYPRPALDLEGSVGIRFYP
jgi:hypothetical protein